jgi:hypothetical protein
MANEVRLIDANALEKRMEERLNSLRKEYGNYDHYTDGFEEGCEAVEYAETLDPVIFRPKGRWKSLGCGEFVCECCWSHVEYESRKCGHNYCPNCGAKMERGSEDG